MKIIAILPVRNEAWIIRHTLTILEQICDVIILADGDSTDKTREIWYTKPGDKKPLHYADGAPGSDVINSEHKIINIFFQISENGLKSERRIYSVIDYIADLGGFLGMIKEVF